ncbi:DUF1631 domain-containing protein [Inmirania thermothiophila]|uniref:Uncharacterized protein DUF1631 n=1 Tax=Inmirania thermothiophila TaxID=1750597 RepID=A0A3N1XZR2_9GAMM|nr:DUF1631 domain-containing protein [Inmirania thermothiophila]ROR32060.1 uncharacterized protein DUF1631 [Inmirania thermothiophila]
MSSESVRDKVVPLGPVRRGPAGISAPEANRLLRTVLDSARRYLDEAVAATLDRLDDTLFRLAERAESNAAQSLYFDAMRETRLRRQALAEAFREHFEANYNALRRGEPSPLARPPADPEASTLELSLVDERELEVSVAVGNMVAKARNLHRQTLYELEQRLALLLGRGELDGDANPFGPEAVCRSFAKACAVLETDTRIVLVVLKLFDQHVVNGLGDYLGRVNRQLADAGVLPEVRPRIRVHPAAPRRPASPQAAGEPTATPPAGEGVYARTYRGDEAAEGDALALIRRIAAAHGLEAAPAPAAGIAPGVLAALTAWQHDPARVAELAGDEVEDPGAVNVVRLVGGTPQMAALGGVDRLVVDIVAMLFDQILDDEAIPEPMKALIGRLQIPILKVALLDKGFFSRRSHPARRLLNGLARAALRWSEDEGRGEGTLYHRVESIVERLLQEFEDDPAVFERLERELTAFLGYEELKAEEAERRSAKAMQGTERLALAQMAADDEIERTLAEGGVPAPVEAFLRERWRELLVLVHRQDGEGSGAWRDAVHTARTLAWSVRPKTSREERSRLVAALPALLRAVTAGCERLAMPEEAQRAFLAELARCHRAAVAGALQDDAPAADAGAAPTAPPEDAEAAEDDVPTLTPVDEDADSGASDVDPFGDLVVEEEITLGEEEAEPEPEDAFDALAAGIEVGTWVEFTEPAGTRVRGKLSWKSPLTGVYLFTNRMGCTLTERTAKGLAAELRRGTARIIEEAPLLDRALDRLLGGTAEEGGA